MRERERDRERQRERDKEKQGGRLFCGILTSVGPRATSPISGKDVPEIQQLLYLQSTINLVPNDVSAQAEEGEAVYSQKIFPGMQ